MKYGNTKRKISMAIRARVIEIDRREGERRRYMYAFFVSIIPKEFQQIIVF